MSWQVQRLAWTGVVLLALAHATSGCSTASCRSPCCAGPNAYGVGDWVVRTELFFGLGLPDGTEVSDEQWDAFVRDEITPRFADGFTIVPARGQWRDQLGIHREPARIVIILHKPDAAVNVHIEEVRDIYKRRCNQTSVLRSDSKQLVSF